MLTQIRPGVSRISPAQIDALYGKLLGDTDNGPMEAANLGKLELRLDLVRVDGVEVLRVRYGNQAITIGASGKIQQASPAEAMVEDEDEDPTLDYSTLAEQTYTGADE